MSESSKVYYCAVFVLIFAASSVRNAAINEKELKRYKSLIEGQGLYLSSDDVEILTVHNFNAKLYGKKHPWVVEFYNTWCGHCQRFAPTWKAFATDVFAWRDVIPIGAIDCSDDDNSPICRDFEIMGYPTLRYFYEDYQEGKGIGVEVPKGIDVNEQRNLLLTKLIEEQRIGRAEMLPKLLPCEFTTTDDAFTDAESDTSIVFLVFEKEGSLYGPAVALDLHSVPGVYVKYALHNNTELIKNSGVTQFPSILILQDNLRVSLLSDNLDSREKVRNAIKEYLKTKGISTPDEKPSGNIPSDRKWTDNNITDMATLMQERQLEVLRKRVQKMGDVVLQMDLETALRYSLKSEISRVRNITGDKFDAVKSYVTVLANYFPFGKNGQQFLYTLRDKLKSKTWISGSEIATDVRNAEGDDKRVFSSPAGWLGCRGTKPNYRGFPCGMWTMFHYLTVNAAEANAKNQGANPKEVLEAMLAYVKCFFGCAECSQHFQEMALEKDMQSVSSLESSVLWLWMAHNTVNRRLAGDATEDPEYPKVQFPISERCPSCRGQDSKWNYTEVLKYLMHVYSNINVRYIGADTRVIHEGLDGDAADSEGGLFRSLDGSMCFVLYVFSFLLIAVLMRLVLRRGYRKKMYVHDILGKV